VKWVRVILFSQYNNFADFSNQVRWFVWFLQKTGQAFPNKTICCSLFIVAAGKYYTTILADAEHFPASLLAAKMWDSNIQ